MLSLKDININIGTWLYLQFKRDYVSKALLIGIRPNKYIATICPISGVSDKNQEAQICVYFHNGAGVYEFNTRVLKQLDDPVEILLLEYPDQVKIREQRSYKRIRCLVSARIQYTIKNRSQIIEGIIKDVSKKGCRITFPIKKIDKEIFILNERIMITCKFPGIPGEQKIVGVIRNVGKGQNELAIGIEFDELAWWAPPY